MHTKGPWKLETESRSPDGSDLLITDSEGHYSIATCAMEDTGVLLAHEGEANARLIAAAPELLAVCRLLAERGAVIATTGLGEQLRAAIAKAKGSL